jgi:hypothetical protein
VQVASDLDLIEGDRRVAGDSSQGQLFLVLGKIAVGTQSSLESVRKLTLVDFQFLERILLAGIELGDDGALVTHILHVEPPLVRVHLVEHLLTDLLVENQPAVR